MTRTVILWSAPRSVSTAVYQSISTLKTTTIQPYLELLIYPYYFSPSPPATLVEDPYQREPEFLPCEPSYNAVCDTLLQNYQGVDVVFAKEMAKHLPLQGSKEYSAVLQRLGAAKVKHTFLVRDPARVVHSHYKLQLKGITIEKVKGLLELYDLYDYITETLQQSAFVMDAGDLLAEPDQMMNLYCKAIDIPFEEHMTTWEAGKIDTRMPVKEWELYFDSVQRSTGFEKVPYFAQKPVPIHELPREMIEHINLCQPRYERILGKCVRPNSTLPVKE